MACDCIKKIEGVDSVSQTEADCAVNGDVDLTGVLVSVKGNAEIRPAIFKVLAQNNFDLYEMSVMRNSLEEVFHAVTSTDAGSLNNSETSNVLPEEKSKNEVKND